MQELIAFVRSHTGLSVASAMGAVSMAMIVTVWVETIVVARRSRRAGQD
ncbi:MAG: hypothetical protein ACJ8DZ_05145 [Allosphingosinicella sp.]